MNIRGGILASRSDSGGEGGLTPPPAKRPRVVGSTVQGEPSSSSQTNPEIQEGSNPVPGSRECSGGTVESGSPSSSDMQSNGVIHENGTSSDFAVNGLSGVIKSNGCEGTACEEEEVGRASAGGESEHICGPVLSRKRKQKQLSRKDTDIVRLIGQHLREMGFK